MLADVAQSTGQCGSHADQILESLQGALVEFVQMKSISGARFTKLLHGAFARLEKTNTLDPWPILEWRQVESQVVRAGMDHERRMRWLKDIGQYWGLVGRCLGKCGWSRWS